MYEQMKPRSREETKREEKTKDSVFGVVRGALGAKSRLPRLGVGNRGVGGGWGCESGLGLCV